MEDVGKKKQTICLNYQLHTSVFGDKCLEMVTNE